MSQAVIPPVVLTQEQEQAVLAAHGAAIEWRSSSGERLGLATFIPHGEAWPPEEILAAQVRARRMGTEYSADELISLRQSLRTPWSEDDLRRLKQPREPGSPTLSTAEVLARLAALEAE